jgi:hypothetical protein
MEYGPDPALGGDLVGRRSPDAASGEIDGKPVWHHIGAVPTRELSRAVAEAVTDAPASLRTLAKAARVPHSTLSRILKGKRKATPQVAASIARALEQWGTRCTSAARGVRRTMRELDLRSSHEKS